MVDILRFRDFRNCSYHWIAHTLKYSSSNLVFRSNFIAESIEEFEDISLNLVIKLVYFTCQCLEISILIFDATPGEDYWMVIHLCAAMFYIVHHKKYCRCFMKTRYKKDEYNMHLHVAIIITYMRNNIIFSRLVLTRRPILSIYACTCTGYLYLYNV